jgi:NAD(P)H-nitrite reductase large subunit
MSAPSPAVPQQVVVVGAGMVAHRLVESLLARDDAPRRITVIGDEGRLPYDRVGLTAYFEGRSPDDLTLERAPLDDERVGFVPGDRVTAIDRARRTVRTASRAEHPYDALVLATGSFAPRPAVDGADLPGCFVYRTLDDLRALESFVRRRTAELGRPLVGRVVGGGLLGLEAAGALQGLGVAATVLQSGTHLMSAQLDRPAGEVLGRLIERRGIGVRTGARTTRLDPDRTGQVAGLELQDGSYDAADVVVFTVGVRANDAVVCSCSGVTAGRIRGAVHDDGCADAAAVKACTKAGATCGSCVVAVKKIVGTELAALGQTVSSAMCEHFDLSRRQLFDAILVAELTTFSAIIARFGRGRGCDVCKPAIASILAGLVGRHVLDGENAALQDTNDHVMDNMQRDGSYSVVPRMPGGEVTPEGLIAVGQVAKDFGLYTKITGGQRIDMFGARPEQLPLIWQRLVDAGFESGHAYGKSLRTVKSCVGSTWCRYGVLDAVGMAVRLELRYRGLRAPHKLKLGVSGCARECAEARGKDVGVIATEKGWNMYVGGNGGFTPRHAQLLAEGLSDAELITAIDRFFLYYIRTADRLQRTAPWVAELEGGIDELRRVIFEDSLGICADLDAAMARHVAGYEDECVDTVMANAAARARIAPPMNARMSLSRAVRGCENALSRRPEAGRAARVACAPGSARAATPPPAHGCR